jgi:hypothetical protein
MAAGEDFSPPPFQEEKWRRNPMSPAAPDELIPWEEDSVEDVEELIAQGLPRIEALREGLWRLDYLSDPLLDALVQRGILTKAEALAIPEPLIPASLIVSLEDKARKGR